MFTIATSSEYSVSYHAPAKPGFHTTQCAPAQLMYAANVGIGPQYFVQHVSLMLFNIYNTTLPPIAYAFTTAVVRCGANNNGFYSRASTPPLRSIACFAKAFIPSLLFGLFAPLLLQHEFLYNFVPGKNSNLSSANRITFHNNSQVRYVFSMRTIALLC